MNERGKTIDKTFLSIDTAEERGFIHRDYLAHCLRWSHVIKWLTQGKRYENARILDIGCGRELPLAKTLYSSRLSPAAYYGVDAGPILDSAMEVFHTGKFPLKVWENCNFLEINAMDVSINDGITPGDLPNVITCFEVLEHVEPRMMLQMLAHAKSLLAPGGTAFFSTPCWDVVSCAANHVNEMKYAALGAIFETHGWIVKNVHGTFASIRDYEHKLSPLEHDLFTRLREYYDVNMLACIFAPLYPAESRNCLWELGVRGINHQVAYDKFKPIQAVPVPWGSSKEWQDMALLPHEI